MVKSPTKNATANI